jgi:ATP-binding cassette subfamily G (WHITE) protein 2 (SNQ2)
LFSARLRQPRGTPAAEIEAYVNKVIDVLELDELADAVIGIPGAGLSIEQRKRTTIGVELVAKPKLLFLDEPTSGLGMYKSAHVADFARPLLTVCISETDGQSAYQILRFLKKLSAAGQSMLGESCRTSRDAAILIPLPQSLSINRAHYYSSSSISSCFSPREDEPYTMVLLESTPRA